LTGNEFNNWIYGNAGDNILDSGGGIDGLIGREGNDSFLFGNLNNGSDNIGFIMDFNSSDDSILLSSSIFTGLDLGALDSSNFYIDPINPISTGAAISYQSSDGSISYWNDGVSTQFANLLVGIAIDSSDFIVI
jgi:serralysin